MGFAFVTLSATSQGLNLYMRNGFVPLSTYMKLSRGKAELGCVPMYYIFDTE